MKKKISINSKGQSILEVLVAMGIFSIILTGIITLILTISNYGSSSEARSLAVNYAQEAVDAIKSIRDNEYSSFFDKNGYYNITKSANGWTFTNNGGNSAEWNDIEGMNLAMRNATGMDSLLNRGRSIYIDAVPGFVPASDARRIRVRISWRVKGTPQAEVYRITTEMYKLK